MGIPRRGGEVIRAGEHRRGSPCRAPSPCVPTSAPPRFAAWRGAQERCPGAAAARARAEGNARRAVHRRGQRRGEPGGRGARFRGCWSHCRRSGRNSDYGLLRPITASDRRRMRPTAAPEALEPVQRIACAHPGRSRTPDRPVCLRSVLPPDCPANHRKLPVVHPQTPGSGRPPGNRWLNTSAVST